MVNKLKIWFLARISMLSFSLLFSRLLYNGAILKSSIKRKNIRKYVFTILTELSIDRGFSFKKTMKGLVLVCARYNWVFLNILVTDWSRETNRFWYVDCFFLLLWIAGIFPPSPPSYTMVDIVSSLVERDACKSVILKFNK